jgi:uncharacterized membrane protein YgaE (UPF0421/DUF939 family)
MDSGLELLLAIIGVIISIMMIVAILKIPKIAKYQRATLLLTALRAKKEGLNDKLIKEILTEAGEIISFGSDI